MNRAHSPKAMHGALVAALAGLLTACTTVQQPMIPPGLSLPAPSQSASGADAGAGRAGTLIVTPLPQPPFNSASAKTQQRDAQELAQRDVATANGEIAAINLQQVPLGTFVQVVFAEVLKRNVNVDAAVLARKDLVTFRSGSAQPAAQMQQAATLLLKSYGVAVVDVGGLVRVLPDNAQLGNLPEIRRSDASPTSPLPLRPVFYLIELQAVRQTDVAGWLKTLFAGRVQVQEDIGRNALLLSGTPDNVEAALEALRVLDQPLMAGRKSVALSPAYWSADDLARRLNEVLTAQGYAVAPLGQLGQQGGIRYPVVLLPVTGVNQIYVFAGSDEVLQHVTTWARTLDRPNERGIGKNYFTYQVKHKDAAELAKTLEQLLSGSRLKSNATTAGVAAAGATGAGTQSSRPTSVVVDQASNMLIFQVDADEYSQIGALLQTLDRPAKAALIEVTVAELSLTDNSQLGVEWLATKAMSSGATVVGGTLGGLSVGSGGATFRVLDTVGAVRATLNALASNNQATILSSPRIQARNGETATIQVGQEVPIITSQLNTGQLASGTGSTGNQVLQTVQYRTTGVILKVKPVIHSGDQIDLEVQQEVSAAAQTNTGVNTSPTFSTRKLETKLTLKNGSTVLMGGLISNDSSEGAAGIPLLKDIPLVGNLFKTQTKNGTRRELVVLITPYILSDNHDAESVTDAFRRMLGPWAQPVGAPLAPPAASPAATPLPPVTPAKPGN